MSALFLYGVLRPDVAPETVRPLLDGIGPGWSATVPGSLWAIPDPQGWYPALLPGEGIVQGTFHEAGDVDMDALARFEGSDYTLTRVTVTSASGELPAVAWLYTADLPNTAERIANGDFAEWLAETGRTPFAP
ncbi:gamma-glutamylcyclotransferase [Croceibacterium sp. TMG7-5b_MA50]|uniref:gamma-glutamylcyclotransferase family protein n=1 Tax=Croceibacterium sp. TMG7-5b_MA50 TaxID=3121290 RepID=UPI0032217ADC